MKFTTERITEWPRDRNDLVPSREPRTTGWNCAQVAEGPRPSASCLTARGDARFMTQLCVRRRALPLTCVCPGLPGRAAPRKSQAANHTH